MKSRKGLVLTALVLFGSLFIAFRSINGADSNEKIAKQQKLLNTVGALLEQQHYSPQKINDDFSKKIFKAYLNQLDGDKSIFTSADVNGVKKFETTIDDEIHGATIQFQPAVSTIYEKRVTETMLFYKDILSKPFDYSINETVQLDG
ncbi:MAG TPA: tail-specific protease, partial [Sediminibacterium sp.]|nr:tail-specific protease [Sediminibacterium sp.]